jgi:hypothetical protein
MMRDELHELLRAPLVKPPEGFAERVLSAIAARADVSGASPAPRWRELVEWLAVAATVLLGMPSLAMYVFAIWTVSGVG